VTETAGRSADPPKLYAKAEGRVCRKQPSGRMIPPRPT
jgi:hypothetical protein